MVPPTVKQVIKNCCCAEQGGGGPGSPTGRYELTLCNSIDCIAPCSAGQSCPPCAAFNLAAFDDVTGSELYGLPPAATIDIANWCYTFRIGRCFYTISNFYPCTGGSGCNRVDPPAGLSYVGRFPRDPVTLCPCLEEYWPELYEVGPDTWSGGIPCGTGATVAFDWPDLYCNGACGSSADQCVKPVGSINGYFRLDGFPTAMNADTSQCDPAQRECASCISLGAGVSELTYQAHDQISGNQCDGRYQQANPCADLNAQGSRACSATVRFELLLQGTATINYRPAITITRSCAHPSTPFGWTDLTIDQMTLDYLLRVDGCTLRIKTCARTTSIVGKLQALLQTADDDDCHAKFQISGKHGYLGPACVQGDCVGTIEPYLWFGTYSPDGLTATYYAGAQWEYTGDVQAAVGNFTFFNSNVQDCRCTGSQSGGASGQWSSGSGPLLELDIPVTFSQLGTWTPVFTSAACLDAPTVT